MDTKIIWKQQLNNRMMYNTCMHVHVNHSSSSPSDDIRALTFHTTSPHTYELSGYLHNPCESYNTEILANIYNIVSPKG